MAIEPAAGDAATKAEQLHDRLSTREQKLAQVEHHTNALQLALGAAEQAAAKLQPENHDLAAECEAMERLIVEAPSNDCEDCDELS